MARDRKRARQRRRSQVAAGRSATEQHLHRANVPGELEHASGEVEEFDAALVRGAHTAAQAGSQPAPEPEDDLELDEGQADEDELNREALAAFGEGGGGGRAGAPEVARDRVPEPAPGQRVNRMVAFLRASWAELQRVQWPDRRQVAQATAVVLGFVAIAGVYLGVADYVAKKIVDAIL